VPMERMPNCKRIWDNGFEMKRPITCFNIALFATPKFVNMYEK
jgi:hypothetical protein